VVLRIDKSNVAELVVFTLSGRIENEKIKELQELLAFVEAKQKISFDLKEVRLVDQRSVEFLEDCETRGVEFWNCPAYLREWILRIRTRSR